MKENEVNLNHEIKLPLSEYNVLNSEEQFEKIKSILEEIYGKEKEIDKASILKCMKLPLSKEDDYLYLKKHVEVEKNAKYLIFKKRESKSYIKFIALLIITLLAALIFATYSALVLIERSKVNIDIDGDGIPDINLDIDGDFIADINIDTDGDEKPDLNVDYKGNKQPMFNIDTDGDGKPDKNLVNNAEGDKDETCEVNCDTNGDGWPDNNFDVDGDGIADLDRKDEETGEVKHDLDLNGDQICDVMCDDDKDGVCDRNCVEPDKEGIGTGSSSTTGDPDNDLNTNANLNVIYTDDKDLIVSDLFPDDQPGVVVEKPTKKFTITNTSDITLVYKLSWVVNENTFTSQNFKYKIDATEGGYNTDYVVAPKEDVLIVEEIYISPNTTQEYVITFNLEGTGTNQNYDQGKQFAGFIKVGD